MSVENEMVARAEEIKLISEVLEMKPNDFKLKTLTRLRKIRTLATRMEELVLSERDHI